MNQKSIPAGRYVTLKSLLLGLFLVFLFANPSQSSVTYVYVGLNFDHQDPHNSALKCITLELTTPGPITDNYSFPDVPQFQALGYKLVISDGLNTISSSDPGFSFSSIAATNRIYSVDDKGLPKTWNLSAQVINKDKTTMSSTYAPGIYAHEGGDNTTKYTPSSGPAAYRAWTLGDSHVGIPVGPGSGKGTWSIKPSTVLRPQVKIPAGGIIDGVDRNRQMLQK